MRVLWKAPRQCGILFHCSLGALIEAAAAMVWMRNIPVVSAFETPVGASAWGCLAEECRWRQAVRV